MAPNLLEQAFAQILALQKVAKEKNRRLVGRGLAAQIDPHEAAHRNRVVERLLDRRVREIEPPLQEVDAQHSLQPDRRDGPVAPLL